MHNILANPVHILPHQLAFVADIINNYNNDWQITLSPKADGVTSVFKDKSLYFNAEDIDGFKYVYDTLSYPIPHNNTSFNRFKWIRSKYEDKFNFTSEYKSNFVCKNIDDVNNLFKNEYRELEKIKNQKKEINWYPKLTFLVEMPLSDFVHIIDNKATTYYPNDGWILSVYNKTNLLFSSPLKIKPTNMMTIDLLYEKVSNKFTTMENTEISVIDITYTTDLFDGIYRCEFVNESELFKPIEQRYDKQKANNNTIVNSIITYHTNKHHRQWRANDIVKYMHDKNIYYPNKIHTNYIEVKIDEMLQNYIKLRHKMNIDILNKIIKRKDIILDIGCGNGSILRDINLYNKYIGIDKDYRCLAKCSKYIKPNDLVIWGDILLDNWGYFDDNIYLNKYDVIIMINTIHLFINHGVNYSILYDNIEKISKTGSIIVIFTLDTNKMYNINYKNQLIVEKLINNTYKFYYSWIDKNFEENIPNTNDIIKYFEKQWERIFVDINSFDNYFKDFDDDVKRYNDFHTILVYKKK